VAGHGEMGRKMTMVEIKNIKDNERNMAFLQV
jgi:hypothetical protein